VLDVVHAEGRALIFTASRSEDKSPVAGYGVSLIPG
jgi:hypothetical protein